MINELNLTINNLILFTTVEVNWRFTGFINVPLIKDKGNLASLVIGLRG